MKSVIMGLYNICGEEMKMEKILVTGGAGFVGSNLIYEILRHENDVMIVCLDSLTHAGSIKTLEPLIKNNDPAFRFVKGDITDREQVFNLFNEERFDMVINCAVETGKKHTLDQSETFLKTNVLGTSILLDAFNQFGIKRFHQVSTEEVYGLIPSDNISESLDEDSLLKPDCVYAASKAAADLLVLSYYKTYGTPVSISRSVSNYGPYQFPDRKIPSAIISTMKGESVENLCNQEFARDWIYVGDHCRAIDLILHEGKIGEIYNVGTHSERFDNNVIQHILEIMDREDLLTEFPDIDISETLCRPLDCTKLETELNWAPEKDFETGLARTVRWYENRKDWWENIEDGTYLDDCKKILG